MSASSKRLFVGVVSTLTLGLLYAALTATTAQATVLTVTNGNDAGAGSLRDMLTNASNGDTINFDSSVTNIVLTTAQLEITTGVTISGPGARNLTITRSTAGGTPDFRIFSVTPGTGNTAAISGVTISNGNSIPGGGVSFIAVGTAQLNLTNVVVSGNNSAWGGGIDGTGSQTGHMTIVSSTISNNTTNNGIATPFANGAAMKLEVPTTIVNSTMSGNQAGDNGGALKVDSAVTILNSTIANNSAATLGGGIWEVQFANSPNLVMRNTLIADNTSGSGNQCDVETNNTTLSVNENNLIEDGSCNFLWAGGANAGSATNFLSGDPDLSSLTDNGGPTDTQALGANSIARESGDSTVCSASPVSGLDQRGVVRPNPCSRGAYDSAPLFSLDVSKSGSGNGTVTSTPAGIDCGSTCSTFLSPGTNVTLTAIAANGSTFSGWTGACSGSTATCDVTMSQTYAVTAEFTAAKAPTSTDTQPTATTGPTAELSTPTTTATPTSTPSIGASLATPATISLTAQAPGLRGDGCVIKTPTRLSFTVPFEVSTDAEMSFVLYYRKRSDKLAHSCKRGSGGSNSQTSTLKTARKWTSQATAGKNKVRIFTSGLKPGSYTLDMFARDTSGLRSKLAGTRFVVVSKKLF